jgi:tetratricopeptide (TPR) repeat protein
MHVIRSVLFVFFGFTLILTVRLALAESASRLHAGLADYDSSPSELRAALSANPRLSSAWIRLGLYTEQDGNVPEAETDLLQAARFDRQYVPAWTLANFYFRRGDAENFWPWARKAAALTFDDYRPLLRLADALEHSPREVALHLGGGAPLLRAYMDLLIAAGRLDAAEEISALLASHHDPSDRARLVDVADRQRRAGRTSAPLTPRDGQ